MTTVRTASKDILARAMAQEDITVEHRADVPSAYFDTAGRTLCLPIWKDMDNSLYDMLVGHEVSHALHTPAEGWQDFIGKGKQSGMRHMFLNVVEDARIERKIKDKFPGIRRDFASAYKSLQDRDLFELADKDISELPLIDRLNLQFKLGLHCQLPVPFRADEQQYVTRMADADTFEDVMELARELYKRQVEEDEEQQEQQESQGQPGAGKGEEGEGQGSSSGSSDGDDEDGQGSSSGLGDEDSDEDGQGSSGSQGDESGEDSGASADDDTDDGESADSSNDGENSENGDIAEELSYDDYTNNESCAGSTQRNFEKGVENLRDENAGEYTYTTLPTPNLDRIVVDFKQIETLWTVCQQSSKDYASDDAVEARVEIAKNLREYQNAIKGTVAQMVQQFQMKQAADADKKTEIAKTGVLDTVNMINYRWSEDIFLKNEVHPDGKNHGMVMYVDWSGSMSGILKDTVEQLLVLVEFCRKVNIPYEVYAFSSNLHSASLNPHETYSDEWEAWNTANPEPEQWNKNAESDCTPHDFQLYNFLSSRMNKRQYQTALSNLWILTETAVHYYYRGIAPRCLALGCTPLNEAVVCAMTQVPAFQQANDIQIVNTVFLTDGDGHGMIRGYGGYGRENKTFIRDNRSKKIYDVKHNETYALLDMLRDKTGSTLVGIRLHDSKSIRHLRWNFEDDAEFQRLSKQYTTQNYITLPSSYDEYFLVKGALKVETDAMEDLADDASYTRIKNAFMKGGNRKKSSRVIATKMVDIFAA